MPAVFSLSYLLSDGIIFVFPPLHIRQFTLQKDSTVYHLIHNTGGFKYGQENRTHCEQCIASGWTLAGMLLCLVGVGEENIQNVW